MKRKFDKTERVGVNKVEGIVINELNWIARQLFQSDFGIDMEIELVENEMPNGRLIACQIKSGESYFKETKDGDIRYYGTDDHLNYWLNHSLPVILIIYNPKKDLTLWAEVCDENVVRTKSGWYIDVPQDHVFGESSKAELEQLNKKYPLYFQRLLRLGLDKSIIQLLQQEKVVLEVSEWVNKTIGRVGIEIKKVDDDSGEEELLSSKGYIFYKGLDDLKGLFPWADLELDDEYYEDDDRQDFLDNYGIWDSEDKKYIDTIITFAEYLESLPPVRSISMGGGEVEFYRFVMKINSLGKSYLKLNDFLEFGNQLKKRF
jgi:hypothetical protein